MRFDKFEYSVSSRGNDVSVCRNRYSYATYYIPRLAKNEGLKDGQEGIDRSGLPC